MKRRPVSPRRRAEADLVVTAERIANLEREIADHRATRNRLIVELRRLPDPPTAGAVAALAGVSQPFVSNLEAAAR